LKKKDVFLRIAIMLLFFSNVFLFSEEKLIVDPLLEKSWIKDALEEEKRSYHRFISSSKETRKIEYHQDAFGRNYHVFPSMKITYAIDNDYHREFPILDDGDLATYEMEALIEARRDLDALFLGKGIGLCQRLHAKKEPLFSPNWANKANELVSKLVSKLDHKPGLIDVHTEPYGCYEGNSKEIQDLYLESETFRYQIKIPANLRYEGLFRNQAGKFRYENKTIMRLVRFVEFLTPLRPENWDEMDEAKILQEAGLTSKAPSKILFSIGSTFDEIPRLRTKKDYFRFWDSERGLNARTMFQKSFVRLEENGDYTSRFKVVDETGNLIYYLMKEYYFYKAPLGFMLALSYPESEKSKGENYWQMIRKDFKVRDY